MTLSSTIGTVRSLVIAAIVVAALSVAQTASAAPAPTFAKSLDASPVAGTVRVTPPGGRARTLTGSVRVPVGSTFDVRQGTVRLTAATGKGGTYSGTFGKGRFEALQSSSRDGATVIRLLGKCAPSGAAPDEATAARSRHRAPVYRQLQVTAQGNFLVEGKDASAVASGGQAHYSLIDACDGTHIVDESGHVVAKHKQGTAKVLDPSDSEISYCFPSAAHFTYCEFSIASPKHSTFSFGVALMNFNARHYGVCYLTPSRSRMCFTGALPSGSSQSAGLFCTINDGPGVYPFRYSVDGRALGPKFHFRATMAAQSFLGEDNCTNQTL